MERQPILRDQKTNIKMRILDRLIYRSNIIKTRSDGLFLQKLAKTLKFKRKCRGLRQSNPEKEEQVGDPVPVSELSGQLQSISSRCGGKMTDTYNPGEQGLFWLLISEGFKSGSRQKSGGGEAKKVAHFVAA